MSETLQLDLDVVLPHAHGAEDRCVAELVASVQRLDGVESAHVTVVGTDQSDGSQPGRAVAAAAHSDSSGARSALPSRRPTWPDTEHQSPKGSFRKVVVAASIAVTTNQLGLAAA